MKRISGVSAAIASLALAGTCFATPAMAAGSLFGTLTSEGAETTATTPAAEATPTETTDAGTTTSGIVSSGLELAGIDLDALSSELGIDLSAIEDIDLDALGIDMSAIENFDLDAIAAEYGIDLSTIQDLDPETLAAQLGLDLSTIEGLDVDSLASQYGVDLSAAESLDVESLISDLDVESLVDELGLTSTVQSLEQELTSALDALGGFLSEHVTVGETSVLGVPAQTDGTWTEFGGVQFAMPSGFTTAQLVDGAIEGDSSLADILNQVLGENADDGVQVFVAANADLSVYVSIAYADLGADAAETDIESLLGSDWKFASLMFDDFTFQVGPCRMVDGTPCVAMVMSGYDAENATYNGSVMTCVVTPDGKFAAMIVAGNTTDVDEYMSIFSIANSFGLAGSEVTELDTVDGMAVSSYGKLVAVTLEENATTGYVWTADFDADSVQLVDDSSMDTELYAEGATGTPTVRQLVFVGQPNGEGVITLTYARSWETTAEDLTYQLAYTCDENGNVASLGLVD